MRREHRAGWLRLWVDYHAYGRSGATALPDAVTEATGSGSSTGTPRNTKSRDPNWTLVATDTP